MSEKELASKFDVGCSVEDLLQYKEELLAVDVMDENDVNELFDCILKTNTSFFDRANVITALVNYICTTGNSIQYIMNLFKELLLKDGCTEEATLYAINVAYRQARNAREMKMQKRILERKRLKKEEEERLKILKERESKIDMSKTCVSYDTARFLARNGTTYEEMMKKINLQVISQEEIDFILYRYRIDYIQEKDTVSIADVVGYNYVGMGSGNDLLKAFPTFFDSKKSDGYHRRSLSMLDLTLEDALEKLAPSFSEEPMKLADAPNGLYTIHGNGMHRYSVLRSLYCIEMINAKGNDEKERVIYEKYKIPVLVSKIDYIKTYANYILTTLKIANDVSNERDFNFCNTGRVKIVLSNDEKLFFTNEELLNYIGDIMRSNKENPVLKEMLKNANQNFLRFLSSVVPEMVEENIRYLEDKNARTI